MAAPSSDGMTARDLAYQAAMLQCVSRTFALTIPQLPGALRDVVGNAYLLCRIVDTIEDEPTLSAGQTQAFAERFVEVVAGREAAEPFARELGAALSSATTASEHDLITNTARVIRITNGFRATQRGALERCVRIMAQGMAEFQRYATTAGLHDLPHLGSLLVLVPVAVDSPRRYTGAMNAIDERACGKPGCDNFGKPGLNIGGHGWFVTKSGRRRRYRCTVCGGTLSTHTGTAYRGLRCSRREFDQVASLRVEGVSISATARVTGHSRPTIARWLERASTAAAYFNHRLLRDFDVIELQADELCTFIGSKRRTLWLFATIEVCSRLWAGSVLGRRSHRNTKAAINDVILRGRLVGCPLIATDGFEYYVGVMVRLLGSACVYGQVLKTRRNNRVVRVERRVKIGTASRLNAALLASEDSEALNTSFIERLNLTIRQGSAYLRRRSPCHARGADQLRGHVELLRCYYNFIRPHRALRFGRETRTPAMQAGLVSQRLALRDIFTAGGLTRRIFVAVVHVSVTVQPTESDEAELSTRCSPSARRQAA